MSSAQFNTVINAQLTRGRRGRRGRNSAACAKSRILVRHLALVNLAQTFRDIFAAVKLLKDRGDASA